MNEEVELLMQLYRIGRYEHAYQDWDAYKITRQDINARLAQIRESK